MGNVRTWRQMPKSVIAPYLRPETPQKYSTILRDIHSNASDSSQMCSDSPTKPTETNCRPPNCGCPSNDICLLSLPKFPYPPQIVVGYLPALHVVSRNYSRLLCCLMNIQLAQIVCRLSFTSMWLSTTSRVSWVWGYGSLTHLPRPSLPARFMWRSLALQRPYHHPPARSRAQLSPTSSSLSLSRVVNFFPLELWRSLDVPVMASKTSPVCPATNRRYLSASSLMENVEYSAEYHRPERRWICTLHYVFIT